MKKKEIIKLVPSIKNLLMVGACHAKNPRHKMYCRLGLAYIKDLQVGYSSDREQKEQLRMLNTEPDSVVRGRVLDLRNDYVTNTSNCSLKVGKNLIIKFNATRSIIYHPTETRQVNRWTYEPIALGEIVKPSISIEIKQDTSKDDWWRNRSVEKMMSFPDLKKYIKTIRTQWVYASDSKQYTHYYTPGISANGGFLLPERLMKIRYEEEEQKEHGYYYGRQRDIHSVATNVVDSYKLVRFSDDLDNKAEDTLTIENAYLVTFCTAHLRMNRYKYQSNYMILPSVEALEEACKNESKY